jgi:hypothetical protein
MRVKYLPIPQAQVIDRTCIEFGACFGVGHRGWHEENFGIVAANQLSEFCRDYGIHRVRATLDHQPSVGLVRPSNDRRSRARAARDIHQQKRTQNTERGPDAVSDRI